MRRTTGATSGGLRWQCLATATFFSFLFIFGVAKQTGLATR